MPRKNFRNKAARRLFMTTYVPADERGEYEITLTDRGATTNVVVTGTRESAWAWARRTGGNGGIKPGSWSPVSLRRVNGNNAAFGAI